MTAFTILMLIFSTMYKIQPDRRWVTAQSLTEPPVYQSDKELTVNIGGTATLRCCVPEKEFGMLALFKQIDRKKPHTIIKFFRSSEEMFYNGLQKSRFQIEQSSDCFNMTILNILQSDEAMYFCALLMTHTPVFGDGTYLKIKGEHVTISSETSKPALHGNNTNMNTQDKTVISLGTALGLCALLIFCLTYYILRTRKLDTSIEDSPGIRQEPEAETLNYAALQFSKRKDKAEEKRNPGSSDGCVYSDVKKSIVCQKKMDEMET
ncbi:uncharacterized protein LOC131357955 [Hemibagrus wyckioides]|uniref:uncharacterized protein LOC131357955 n=1 Tax=Hemibagrus wyckioides TaxID=337641 RepID=UPI00266C784E|nr:uncharacterized protein LOC131357955 [Hemibagrus wyckioides]